MPPCQCLNVEPDINSVPPDKILYTSSGTLPLWLILRSLGQKEGLLCRFENSCALYVPCQSGPFLMISEPLGSFREQSADDIYWLLSGREADILLDGRGISIDLVRLICVVPVDHGCDGSAYHSRKEKSFSLLFSPPCYFQSGRLVQTCNLLC